MLIVAVALVPVGFGLAALDAQHARDTERRQLAGEAQQHAAALDSYFAAAQSNMLLIAHDTGFRDFYAGGAVRGRRVFSGSPWMRRAERALRYIEHLYPGAIGEACFIDRAGPEDARVVDGRAASVADLSLDESGNPFFRPTFALRPGEVYQAQPYVSPDTHEWVVSNSTPLPGRDGAPSPAIVHFEVTVESFRRALAAGKSSYVLRVIDTRTGAVVIDGRRAQRVGAPLGVPGERHFAAVAGLRRQQGVTEVGDRLAAFDSVATNAHNANHWMVVAVARQATPTLLESLGPASIVMLALAGVMLSAALSGLRASRRELERQATEDVLTGLANRRQLFADLTRETRRSAEAVLLLLDLDGFKTYNDTFGHLAGDALLTRLGRALATVVAPYGRAYRLGGDEFCVLAHGQPVELIKVAASRALEEHGDGFTVRASCGAVALPSEARDAEEALRLADQRMYEAKTSGRPTAGSQSTTVLLRALAERHPSLGDHTDAVVDLAQDVAAWLGLDAEQQVRVRRAAELHDIGKVGIPDSILLKPGPLNEDEWAFMRRHTAIGERILAGAPALAGIAPLVRSSHEHWDGGGYPDGLAEEAIPLEARIIAICDSFDAMTVERSYSPARSAAEALREIRRCSGTQFDPVVVEAFSAVLVAAGERLRAEQLVA